MHKKVFGHVVGRIVLVVVGLRRRPLDSPAAGKKTTEKKSSKVKDLWMKTDNVQAEQDESSASARPVSKIEGGEAGEKRRRGSLEKSTRMIDFSTARTIHSRTDERWREQRGRNRPSAIRIRYLS